MKKTIQLNGIKYQCPTGWEDITVADQIRVSEIAAKYTGLTKNLQLIAGYCNIPVEEIKKTNINKLGGLVQHLSFLGDPISQDPITEFKHRGHKYKIIPTLIDAEFQDFISLETVINNYNDNPYDALPMMIAILAKRDGESLDDYDIEERAKEFLDLPIDTANRVSVFFSQIAMMSHITDTLTSSEQVSQGMKEEVTRQFEELETTIQQSGGQGLRGRLQRWILRKWKKSLKSHWDSYLIGTASKS